MNTTALQGTTLTGCSWPAQLCGEEDRADAVPGGWWVPLLGAGAPSGSGNAGQWVSVDQASELPF